VVVVVVGGGGGGDEPLVVINQINADVAVLCFPGRWPASVFLYNQNPDDRIPAPGWR